MGTEIEVVRIDPPHEGATGPTLPAILGVPLPETTLDLMSAIWADVGARTIRAYSKDYADFARFLGARDGAAALEGLLSLSAGDANALALAYRASMQERGLKPATIARRLGALRKAVKIARTLGRVAWTLETPTPRVERYKDVRGPGLMGFVKMLAELDGRTDAKGVRDRAIMRILWGLALRRGELVGLDYPADVDLDGNRLAVLGKGRTDKEWLTLPAGAKDALVAWLVVRGREPGPLFRSLHLGRPGDRLTDSAVFKIVRALGVGAGLDRPTRPHGIRHASITECSRRTNGNAVATQRFGRHRSSQTTARYIDEHEDTFGKVAAIVDGALDG